MNDYFKHKIKDIVIRIPGFSHIYQMKQDYRDLERRYKELSEPIAKQLAELDLAEEKRRYFAIRKLADCFSEENEQLNQSAPYYQEALILKNCHKLVSIIILNKNGSEKLKVLMNSFHSKSFYSNFEIIFVDNASTDNSVTYMHEWENEFKITIIQNNENMSFSAANNLGARYAHGDYLLFLNNDTEVSDGWLDELIIAMEQAKNPGAIGAKLLYPHIPEGTVNFGKSYRIQHAGIAFRPVIKGKSIFIEPYNIRNNTFDELRNETLTERAAVTAAVLMMKRSVFEEIGGFDEEYFYGFEDVDLGLRLIKAGYMNYYCPHCLVFHYEFGTQQRDALQSIIRRNEHNTGVFSAKWQEKLRKRIFAEKLNNIHLHTESNYIIKVILPEHFSSTTAEKNAYRFLKSIANTNYEIRIIHEKNELTLYDIGVDVDLLLVFCDRYNIKKITNYSPLLHKTAFIDQAAENQCKSRKFDSYTSFITFSSNSKQINNKTDFNGSLLILPEECESEHILKEFVSFMMRFYNFQT